MVRYLNLVLILVGCAMLVAAARQQRHSYVPPEGFVPDSITAIRIAEAVWIPIYGQRQVRRERPFRTTLRGGVWTVTGTLHPPGSVGGVALAEIAKRDGRILRVSHGR